MQLPPEMYATYIQRRKEDFENLKTALQNADASLFKKIGHQLKGNATSFGFDELAELGKKMETVDPSNIKSLAPMLLSDFDRWIQSKK